MWFVSKKKYDEMVQSRERWKVLADRWMSHTEEAHKTAEAWERVAISCQEDNKRLVAHEEEMLAKMKELDNAYGRLETDYDRLREERDHYEERCRYLEGEIEDKEELEDRLAFMIGRKRDHYYDLLETTNETEGDTDEPI